MFKFTLNQNDVTVEADKNLLEYLREDARLISVKDGCAEGVCGSCSVLVDGKAWRACKLTIAKVQGKAVTTLEGLPTRERDIYSWAFGEVGAVQCGFCMPGVVISAKSLLDQNSAPTSAKIKNALRYNLCRCTGYLKIERAIQLVSKHCAMGKLSAPRAARPEWARAWFAWTPKRSCLEQANSLTI